MNAESIGCRIQSLVQGQVLWDKQSRKWYSVDASSYVVKPLLVVIPKDEHDVTAVLKYASKRNIPVTPRGAGTGLVGSALGDGIVLDLRNFNKIKVHSNYVQAGSGVFKGHLDKKLEKRGKFFGPNPSVGPYCTLGGMVATNASGSHSLKYGSTIDNLLGVRIITSKGKIVELPSDSPFSNRLFKTIKKNMQEKFPAVSKNSCGYRIDKVTSKSELQKIIAGSEGTLGVIVSAKLRIFPIRKKIMLAILAYKTVEQAAVDSAKISKLSPSALELVDHNIIKHIKAKLIKNTACLLFVEFDEDLEKIKPRLEETILNATMVAKITKKPEIKKWWNYRNSALSYSLNSISRRQSMPTIIEDAVVPVEKLVLLVKIIKKISKKYGMKFVLYGHAGNGNLHIRPILESKNKKFIKKIATEYFTKVIEIGGCITAEHGDGFARSEFIKSQYGNEVYSVFKKIKKAFDPNNILNPDKKITTKSLIIKNLKI